MSILVWINNTTFVASEILAWVCALAILYYYYLYMFITYSIIIKRCRCSWSRAVKHRCCKSIFNSSIIAYDATRGIYTLEITIINCMLHRVWMYAYIHIYIHTESWDLQRTKKSWKKSHLIELKNMWHYSLRWKLLVSCPCISAEGE